MDSENDGLDYAFSSDGTTSFVGEVSFVDQSGVISTKPISFSPQSPPPTFPKSKIVKLDYFQIYRKLYNLNPRHLPVLFQFLDLENNDISFYEWWSKTGMVQLVPTRGISLNNGEIAVTPSMGASSIIFKPQGSFLYADAIEIGRAHV